jgi:LmbE family N-acetylglucosaminyl deacetylase
VTSILRKGWSAAVAARARDVTQRSATASCIVFAPHPDDETLGCGATIHRKREAGTAVHVVIASDGRRSQDPDLISPDELACMRAHEALNACITLGVAAEDVHQLGYHDGTLHGQVPELASRFVEFIDAVRPDEVLATPRVDNHADHRAVNQAVRLALSRTRVHPRLAEYPIGLGPVASCRLLVLGAERGRGVERVSTGRHLVAKSAAARCHRSQVENLTGDSRWQIGLETGTLATFLQPYEIFFPVGARNAP